ncbi:MAG: GNAT family N-acetyltransferase [Planctomycetales bacterium]|nr:GNAT family N-acetyltransferase [Planctomycetales bacterium]
MPSSFVAAAMALTYFKRFRMEMDLTRRDFSTLAIPEDYRLLAWEPGLLEPHADVKHQAFRFEVDANVFPCFAEREGCLRLMGEICNKDTFLPESTWLAMYAGAGRHKREFCGTVSGLCEVTGYGAIQNLGITPLHRGRGLGRYMMYRALAGFQSVGLRRAYLEVTAQNEGAVQMYRQMGFRRVRTLYKAVEVAYS